jgi:hypothetical protein
MYNSRAALSPNESVGRIVSAAKRTFVCGSISLPPIHLADKTDILAP